MFSLRFNVNPRANKVRALYLRVSNSNYSLWTRRYDIKYYIDLFSMNRLQRFLIHISWQKKEFVFCANMHLPVDRINIKSVTLDFV